MKVENILNDIVTNDSETIAYVFKFFNVCSFGINKDNNLFIYIHDYLLYEGQEYFEKLLYVHADSVSRSLTEFDTLDRTVLKNITLLYIACFEYQNTPYDEYDPIVKSVLFRLCEMLEEDLSSLTDEVKLLDYEGIDILDYKDSKFLNEIHSDLNIESKNIEHLSHIISVLFSVFLKSYLSSEDRDEEDEDSIEVNETINEIDNTAYDLIENFGIDLNFDIDTVDTDLLLLKEHFDKLSKEDDSLDLIRFVINTVLSVYIINDNIEIDKLWFNHFDLVYYEESDNLYSKIKETAKFYDKPLYFVTDNNKIVFINEIA